MCERCLNRGAFGSCVRNSNVTSDMCLLLLRFTVCACCRFNVFVGAFDAQSAGVLQQAVLIPGSFVLWFVRVLFVWVCVVGWVADAVWWFVAWVAWCSELHIQHRPGSDYGRACALHHHISQGAVLLFRVLCVLACDVCCVLVCRRTLRVNCSIVCGHRPTLSTSCCSLPLISFCACCLCPFSRSCSIFVSHSVVVLRSFRHGICVPNIIPYTAGVLAVVACTLTYGYLAPPHDVEAMASAMKGESEFEFGLLVVALCDFECVVQGCGRAQRCSCSCLRARRSTSNRAAMSLVCYWFVLALIVCLFACLPFLVCVNMYCVLCRCSWLAASVVCLASLSQHSVHSLFSARTEGVGPWCGVQSYFIGCVHYPKRPFKQH